MAALLLVSIFGTVFAACPNSTPPEQVNRDGCDSRQLGNTTTYEECAAACCDDYQCVSWNWDSNLDATRRPAACKVAGTACCWLKSCDGPKNSVPCGGAKNCTSWSGTSGHPTPPPPSPPCPPGQTCFHNQGTREGVTKSYDCAVRTHAWEFAKTTLPQRGSFRTAYDALQLQACGVPTPPEFDKFIPPTYPTPSTGHLVYADPNAVVGGDGSQAKPFRTLEAAVDAAGELSGPVTIMLHSGTYHTSGVTLTTKHSGLTITNINGGDAVISGAVPVASDKAKWTHVSGNTWKLDTSGQGLPTEYGLRVGTRRGIRAKWPNGDPETASAFCVIPLGSIASPGVYLPGSGVCETYPQYFPRLHDPINTTEEWWAYPEDWPGTFWHDADGVHPKSIGGYGPFFYSAGGVCSGRTPSHGYWCSANNPRAEVGQHNIDPPGGFFYGDVLPQAAKYSNPRGAIVHARGGSMPYFSYQCVVTNVSDGKIFFDPAIGCDQGGPTPYTPGKAWDWFIENVKEECDSPMEYFYDVEEEALYFTFNGTDTPTGDEDFYLTRTKVLFNISGSMDDPVQNVTIRGLTLRDAAYTYLGTTEADRHWLPSEGDWALQRSGAITMEGASGIHIDQNQITRVDGNGIFLGGYTRKVKITRNDFNWIGDSAMAAFGWTSDCLNANCSVRLPAKVGPDGRGGEQPRGTYVGGNLVREIGIWQKQSSAWFQALSAQNIFESNVFFNGPRAAINFNDAFGGGNKVIGNLMFNQVRETVDHGTLNAWERGPYFSDIGYVPDASSNLRPTADELDAGAIPGFKLDTGKGGSAVGQYTTLAYNFLLGNYNVNSNLETDDGSSRYLMYRNYFVYSTAATDFAMNAHYNYYVDNVHAYGETILRGWGPAKSSASNAYVYNCTFFMLKEQPLCGGSCLGSVLDASAIHTNATAMPECRTTATSSVKLAPPASDSFVTLLAKKTLRNYPKPLPPL